MKIPLPFVSRHILYWAEALQFSPAIRSFEILVLRENVPEICDTFGLSEAQANHRFAHGDLCFVAHDGGKCLGMVWGHRGDCYVRGAGRRMDLDQNGVYLYGIYTNPEARRMNVFNNLKDAFFRYYLAQGMDHFCALVHPDNHIMINALQRIGFVAYYYLQYVSLVKFGFLCEIDIRSGKRLFSMNLREPHGLYLI
jgi:hypothetical protein